MESTKTTVKPLKFISMSDMTREKITIVADSIKGKNLFSDKIALAKKTLSDLKSLPI